MTTTKTTEQIKEAIRATAKEMCETSYKIALKQKDEIGKWKRYFDITANVLSALSYQIGYLGIENGEELITELENIRDKYLNKL